jgi:hypothetical protein
MGARVVIWSAQTPVRGRRFAVRSSLPAILVRSAARIRAVVPHAGSHGKGSLLALLVAFRGIGKREDRQPGQGSHLVDRSVVARLFQGMEVMDRVM